MNTVTSNDALAAGPQSPVKPKLNFSIRNV